MPCLPCQFRPAPDLKSKMVVIDYYFNLFQPQMKYLAAYALLSLSGKKDISTNAPTQLLRTSKDCSEASNPTQLMTRSTKLSQLSRVKPSISSSEKARPVWEARLPPLPRLRRRKPPKRRRRSPSQRRRSPRRRLLKSPRRRKMLISEICSDDQYIL